MRRATSGTTADAAAATADGYDRIAFKARAAPKGPVRPARDLSADTGDRAGRCRDVTLDRGGPDLPSSVASKHQRAHPPVRR